jgi:thiamine-monophosphate kinase
VKLGELGEFALLDRLGVEKLSVPGGWVGPGDDAAVVAFGGEDLIVSSDLLLEGVHFRLSTTSPEDLGWKTLAVNLSDLAAMGAEPLAFTVSSAWPPDLDAQWVEDFYRGIEDAAGTLRCPLVGGDTSSGPTVFLAVTVLGKASRGEAVLRSTARAGQDLYVSGHTGESAAGLSFLEAGRAKEAESLVRRHKRPEPRLGLGRLLAGRRLATAMIDVSDGLAQDAGHIARRSRVAVRIEAAAVPLSAALVAGARVLGRDALPLALSGGEDYELLFTAEPRSREAVAAAASEAGVVVTRIGCTEEGTGAAVIDERGAVMKLERGGYDHFRAGKDGE